MKTIDNRNLNLRIPITKLIFITVTVPFFTFLTCIYLSLANNFEAATATHCGVINYLPSISAAVGEFVPQRYIWQLGIALQSGPRIFMNLLYWRYIKNVLTSHSAFHIVGKIAIALSFMENMALLGLSFVSSSENYNVHKFFFCSFMFCSEMYMLLFCLLFKENKANLTKPSQLQSYKLKKCFAAFNYLSFFFALIFFYQHNHSCQSGLYTMFALCEYFVVLSNMGFHATAFYDFRDNEIVIGDIETPS